MCSSLRLLENRHLGWGRTAHAQNARRGKRNISENGELAFGLSGYIEEGGEKERRKRNPLDLRTTSRRMKKKDGTRSASLSRYECPAPCFHRKRLDRPGRDVLKAILSPPPTIRLIEIDPSASWSSQREPAVWAGRSCVCRSRSYIIPAVFAPDKISLGHFVRRPSTTLLDEIKACQRARVGSREASGGRIR